jgi:succinoglycan biosynthesis transport protein ExoP
MQAQNLPTALYESDVNLIDLLHYWHVVRRSWAGILGLCIVVSMLAALWVMRVTPVYLASTTIMIESQEANTVSIEEVYSMPSRMREYFLTQFQIIKNRDIAELVANELDLWNHPHFAPPRRKAGTEEEGGFKLNIRGWLAGLITTGSGIKAPVLDAEEVRRAAVLNKLMGQLSVAPVEFTQLVVVSFASTDRKLAALVVNTLAQVYIQSQLDAKLQSTREAGNWLSSRLDDLKINLDTSQQALQQFRDQEEFLEMAGAPTLGDQELNELTTRLGEARRARIGAEIIYRELGGVSDYSVTQLMSMPAVLKHPLVASLAQALTQSQQEVANLGKRYGPEHPKMMTANSRRESVQAELKEQVRQVTTSIETEYRVAHSNEQKLAGELAEMKQQMASRNRKEFRLQELEQKVETDQRMYEMFFTRSRETSEAIGFQSAHARVVEKAAPPISPIKPDKKLTVMLAFIISAVLGVGLAILRDMLDKTLRSPDDVADRLDAPLLGVLPNIKLKKGYSGPYLGYLEDTKSSFSEAIRSVRTGLVLSGLEKPHKITVVTSTNPGEGKSTVAINLAAALAQMESVLLIDADLRRPSAAKAFELPSGAPGLSNLLAKSDELDACIHKSNAGYDVLPAGIVPANPLELLSTTRFKTLVRDLAKRYDRVIIDSAPVNMVSDSLILATLADSLVYVVKADSTPHRLAQKNINLIKHSNLPLTGVVLNRLDTKKQAAYGNDGYNSTYYGYGQS